MLPESNINTGPRPYFVSDLKSTLVVNSTLFIQERGKEECFNDYLQSEK